tara:strand:- start:14812 stop:15741 length:930 start_codon:yes stop_codon:yes gene_type:complete
MGSSVIAAGTRQRVELPVARLPVGTWLSLPTEVVHGAYPGPTIWLSSAIHGDELNGVPIVRRTLQELDANTLRGTVVAVPVVNVFGLVSESRYLPDRRDLNRSFPGSKRGSMASQLAHLFMTEVVQKCDLGIDYHTGSGGRTNLPQIRCDLDDRETRLAARHFGTSIIAHSKLRDGSLRAAAGDFGIRCLLYEAGEASRLSTSAIEIGVAGTLRVLAHLKMIPSGPPKPTFTPKMIRHSKWVRAARSGFFEMAVQAGDVVKRGEVLGHVHSAISDKSVSVKAPNDGIVIGHQTTALVHRGNAVVHLSIA